jgi:trans-aconitate 2-methyltransferase
VSDAWDPPQYRRFADERRAPFLDLLDLIQPTPGGDVLDLGCGTGELTVLLHRRLGAGHTTGMDNSPSMLEQAERVSEDGVTFRAGDLAAPFTGARWDVIASNAALHWVPDHAGVLSTWLTALKPGGQLAVQVPANADHPSHFVAAEVAREFVDDPPGDPVAANVCKPEEYAAVLYRLGCVSQHVRLQVYGHELPSSTDVVEWVKGTSLTRFRSVMDDTTFDAFLIRYRARLLEVIGDASPYFYPFKRILFWGRMPG